MVASEASWTPTKEKPDKKRPFTEAVVTTGCYMRLVHPGRSGFPRRTLAYHFVPADARFSDFMGKYAAPICRTISFVHGDVVERLEHRPLQNSICRTCWRLIR